MTDERVYTDADAPPDEHDTPALDEYDTTAERSVIGGMLLSSKAVDDVIDVLSPSDLYDPRHELIARAIAALHHRGEPTDVVAVSEELRKTGELRRAGGHYLFQLAEEVPTAANAGYYALAVKQAAAKRRLVSAGIRIQAMGRAPEGDVEDLIETARAELEQVPAGRRAKVRPIFDTLGELIDSLGSKPQYSPSPWAALNKLIGGFAAGALYVVAARPGSGKSIAALQIAAQLAHEGSVAFCSLEMTEAEMQKRLLAQYGPLHMGNLRSHTFNANDRQRLVEARQRVMGAPIFVDETAAATMAQIRAHVRAVARTGNLAMVVVDYLQLVKAEGQSRQEQVGAVSRELKQLAKDFQVPVVAAAQLRRAGERRGARSLPGLDDLRESGSIEQDADVVLLLDRRDQEKHPRDLTVVVAKNRHGELGKFTLLWQAEYARLLDKAWTATALIEEEEL